MQSYRSGGWVNHDTTRHESRRTEWNATQTRSHDLCATMTSWHLSPPTSASLKRTASSSGEHVPSSPNSARCLFLPKIASSHYLPAGDRIIWPFSNIDALSSSSPPSDPVKTWSNMSRLDPLRSRKTRTSIACRSLTARPVFSQPYSYDRPSHEWHLTSLDQLLIVHS